MQDRYIDLLRQGFMKPQRDKAKAKPKAERPIVACDACCNWHRLGKHTLSAEERKANLMLHKRR